MDLIGDLELMQDLAELGSFSAVGRQRSQAASSIARRLDRLEAHVGERLFNRAPTGLFLTAAGARKLVDARELTAAAAAFAERDEDNGQLRGHIVISAPSRLGEVCIAPIVGAFLEAHPAVSIDLHLTDAVQDLDRGRIDLAVRIGGTSENHHIIRRIANNRRAIVAAPAYLEHRGPIVAVEDLDGCDGLLLGDAPSWRLLGPGGQSYLAKPRARLKCVSGDIVRTMCVAGLGVALKSYWDVQSALVDGTLVEILPDWTQANPVDVMIVMPDRRLTSATLRAFRGMLEKRLKSMLAVPSA
ncbi:LysR family transcriptional regulator [uncultured Tateyamaria sp.]|uniref:LysR family transcriptional regulator n=1 Tax=uncultured Tateyamaria sp. TaxID=455651 RepID=UPI002604372C|nr:LysR family transcriptional regulator [uncultured Tateyamaria sp.]